MKLFVILVLFSHLSFGQAVVLGNHRSICFQDTTMLIMDRTLPDNLDSLSCILIFSGSTSQFKEQDIDRITDYVQNGGGLYLGADNWPLQSESNQITNALYSKESYGEFREERAEANIKDGNLHLSEIDTIPAGQTIVAFPLDPRLTVEAWINDAPLILSGRLGNGRIIIDGGYSRFYCNSRNKDSDIMFDKILMYLCGERFH